MWNFKNDFNPCEKCELEFITEENQDESWITVEKKMDENKNTAMIINIINQS